MSEDAGLPRIGEKARDFHAAATSAREFEFSVWQEQDWVVFFSHSADFTPVCTTELMEFSRRYQDFKKKGVKLLGISVDGIHSHLAWLDTVQQKMGVTVPYPLVADVDMRVSRLYGMIHPGASSIAAVRALFVIDPQRVIRGLICYPMNVGRNVDEVLRLVSALQTAEKRSCATPVNWREGDTVAALPPQTVQDVEKQRTRGDQEGKDISRTLKNPKTDPKTDPKT